MLDTDLYFRVIQVFVVFKLNNPLHGIYLSRVSKFLYLAKTVTLPSERYTAEIFYK